MNIATIEQGLLTVIAVHIQRRYIFYMHDWQFIFTNPHRARIWVLCIVIFGPELFWDADDSAGTCPGLLVHGVKTPIIRRLSLSSLPPCKYQRTFTHSLKEPDCIAISEPQVFDTAPIALRILPTPSFTLSTILSSARSASFQRIGGHRFVCDRPPYLPEYAAIRNWGPAVKTWMLYPLGAGATHRAETSSWNE